MTVRRLQAFSEPLLAVQNARRPRIVRAIRKPHREIPAMEALCDGNTFSGVLERVFAHLLVRVAKGSVFVLLVLKKIGINRAGPNPVAAGKVLDLIRVPNSLRKIPQNMERYSGTDAGDLMDESGIAEFLFRCSGCCRLDKFSETSAGICEAPRRALNTESNQGT